METECCNSRAARSRRREPVGPYPLVDVDTAVARLSDGFFGGLAAGGGIAIAEPALPTVGVAEAVTVEGDAVAGDPGEPPMTGDEPVEPVEPIEPVAENRSPRNRSIEEPVEPMPVEPVPDGEPVVITLVDVQADLWWASDAEGAAWLLPAYRFIDTEGGWHVVPAVADEFLIQVEPPVIDTPLPEPAPEPLPAPPPDAPEVIEPGVDPEAALELFDEFVGLSIEEFAAEATALGYDHPRRHGGRRTAGGHRRLLGDPRQRRRRGPIAWSPSTGSADRARRAAGRARGHRPRVHGVWVRRRRCRPR